MKILSVLILVFVSLTSKAGLYSASSLAFNHVIEQMAAISAAGPGPHTLVLPAGAVNYTQGTNWSPPANVTIVGAGTGIFGGNDLTIFTNNNVADSPIFRFNVTNGGKFRFSGITIAAGAETIRENGPLAFYGPGVVEMDSNHFYATNYNNAKVIILGSGIRGVARSSKFDFQGYSAFYVYNGRSAGENDPVANYEWSLPTDPGGTNYFFIEDNIINGLAEGGWTVFPSRVYDGFSGAKMVVRFNTMTNMCVGETHATGHAPGDRGLRAQEAYGNRIYSTHVADGKEPNFAFLDCKGGTTLAWGNSFDQVYKMFLHLRVTRQDNITYEQVPAPDGWGYTGAAHRTGVVDVAGTTVTWVSGGQFDTGWRSNTMIYITDATGKAFVNQQAGNGPSLSIASVASATSLTLDNSGHIGGNLSSKSYWVGSVWDGNQDFSGYPTIDQPGRGQGDLITNVPPYRTNLTLNAAVWPRQALEPIYVWDNVGGIVSGYSTEYYATNGGARIVPNRDFYPQASGVQTTTSSPFNGTVGTGWGTIANRPSTCTEGVAYFASDEGSWNTSSSNPYGVQMNGADGVLYKATSANTWTLYYVPARYPSIYASDGTTIATGTNSGKKTTRPGRPKRN